MSLFPVHVPPAYGSSSASASHESGESCLVGCCRLKPLHDSECMWSTSSLLQGHSSARAHHRNNIFHAAKSITASCLGNLAVERLAESMEVHAHMASLPQRLESVNGASLGAAGSFSVSNGASVVRKAGSLDKEACLQTSRSNRNKEAMCLSSIDTEADYHLFPNGQASVISSALQQDHSLALATIPEEEKSMLEQEKLRRMRISEANKNQVPWNKGKTYTHETHASHGATTKNTYTDSELLLKEKQRRQKIAAANAGKVPWNKGRQHSEETKQRIRQRTAEAMKDPKIREKLRIHATTLSAQTKLKISASLAVLWEHRRKLKQDQQMCFEEWKECVADAARRGYDDDVELKWNSYNIILKELQQAWKLCRKKKKKSNSRPPLTPAHRIKISKAIKAKWADTNYRNSVEAGIHALRGIRGKVKEAKARCHVKRVTVKVRKAADERSKATESYEMEMDDEAMENILAADSELLLRPQNFLPSYTNPSSPERLEKLRQIRVRRRSKETTRKNALQRARILMAGARNATRALEAAAARDESALRPLQEARQLLAEAAESFKAAGFGGDVLVDLSNCR